MESMKHKAAIAETQWCLQEAFKEAVRVACITDWSKETDKKATERHVEVLQVEIAKMIQTALHS